MVQSYISLSISSTLHYSFKIHPYVGEFLYLCSILVFLLSSGTRNKRESGENPGQSRCCKLHNQIRTILLPLSAICTTGRRPERSKSEDLPVTANVFTLEDLEWDTCTYIFTVLLKTPEIKMVYAEVLYDVATIRKIQGFYLKDPPVASCRCFFLCLFGAELFWQKKSQAGFTCDFRNY